MHPEWILTGPLIAGYLLDLLFGDPRSWPHPVKGFGWLIAKGTACLNKGPYRFLKGGLLATGLCVGVYALSDACLGFLLREWLPGYYILSTLAVFFSLANRSLLQEGKAVFGTLDREGLEAGRKRLSFIVGRDTAELSAQQVRIAVLESMSENLSDGVVAPLLFYMVGGAPAMLLYKMINTLDSMVGYKREPFRLFGRAAARLDDAANFIPARVTAVFMVLVTASRRGWTYIWRYGSAHASPNSGYPEAALAGILDCRFGGPNRYKGILVDKPWIGQQDREIRSGDFQRVVYINHTVTLLTILLIIIKESL